MKRLAVILIGLACFALPDRSDAGSCGVAATNYQSNTYSPPTYAAPAPYLYSTFALFLTPVQAVAIVPQPIVPPAASPLPATAKPTAAGPDRMAALEGRMSRIEALLEKIASGPGGPPPNPQPQTALPTAPNPNAPTVVGLLKARCAACHDKAIAADKGGSFVMFEGGQLVALSDSQISQIMRRAYLKTMPPKKSQDKHAPLTDEEYTFAVEHQDELKTPAPVAPASK